MTQPDEIAWLGGVIDAEGSIELRLRRMRRGRHWVMVRSARLRLKTCDHVIVPRVARWLRQNYAPAPAKNLEHSDALALTVVGGRLRALLPQLIPHLYTKQPQAKLVLRALNIKAGSATAYTRPEAEEWQTLRRAVAALNRRGLEAANDTALRRHRFSWAWLAGLVDGDGSILVAKFGKNGRTTSKPILKISLTHHSTVQYLADKLGRGTLKSGGGRGKKRRTTAVRLMSGDLLRILPEINKFLSIKKPQSQLALRIVQLRAETPNGCYRHPNVAAAKPLLAELRALNATSKKSRRRQPM